MGTTFEAQTSTRIGAKRSVLGLCDACFDANRRAHSQNDLDFGALRRPALLLWKIDRDFTRCAGFHNAHTSRLHFTPAEPASDVKQIMQLIERHTDTADVLYLLHMLAFVRRRSKAWLAARQSCSRTLLIHVTRRKHKAPVVHGYDNVSMLGWYYYPT